MARFTEQLPQTKGSATLEKYEYLTYAGVTRCAMYSYANAPKNPVCYYNYKKRHHSKIFEIHHRMLDYCTVFIFYEGSFGFIFDDIAFHPSRGDIFIVKNNVEFSSFFPENTYIDCYEITFPMDFFDYFGKDSMFHRIFFEHTKNGSKIASSSNVAAKNMLQKFNELDEVINSNSENSDILSFSYIIQILGIIDSQMNNTNPDSETTKVPKNLKKAVNYIHEKFTEQITIADVSDYCEVSNTYLARIFKKVYMCTPLEYLTRLRINYAKRLLTKGASVSEACYNSGFTDYKYFIAKFKSSTGTTPSKYKKS